jgi:hypothetical protein
MSKKHPFRTAIVRFIFFVTYRPRRRNSSFMLEDLKVLSPKPWQCRPVNLCVAADEVMDAWRKRATSLVKPLLLGFISLLLENSLGTPILGFDRQEVASF